jgi:hypothetical protein
MCVGPATAMSGGIDVDLFDRRYTLSFIKNEASVLPSAAA